MPGKFARRFGLGDHTAAQWADQCELLLCFSAMRPKSILESSGKTPEGHRLWRNRRPSE